MDDTGDFFLCHGKDMFREWKFYTELGGTLGLWAFDPGAFANSQLGGDVILQDNPFVSSDVFAGCKNITSAVVPGYSIQFAEGIFAGCSSLTSVTLGEFGLNSYLYANVFDGCSSLTDITFTGGEPELSIYGTQPFQFNSYWTREEEVEHIKLHVMAGNEAAFAKKWRYLFCGYYELGSDTAYLRMWSDLQWEFIDWDTWEFLPDEQIDSIWSRDFSNPRIISVPCSEQNR